MALSELKQTEAELKEYGVQSAPDKLTGSAAENKMIFDRLFQNVGMSKFNLLLDYLLDGTAASEMGINYIPELADAETVQKALEAIVRNMKSITQGGVPNGSITTEKLANAAVTALNIAARAITGSLIAEQAVNTEHLRTGAVTHEKITDGAVTLEKLDLRVTAEALGGIRMSTHSTFVMEEQWNTGSKKVTISVPNVGPNPEKCVVFMDAADDTSARYVADYGVRASVQGNGTVTLSCREIPPMSSLSLSFVVLRVGT